MLRLQSLEWLRVLVLVDLLDLINKRNIWKIIQIYVEKYWNMI